MASTQEKLTRSVKVPSALTKAECLQELAAFQVAVSADLSVPELRSMVKQSRIDAGLMTDRRKTEVTVMSQIEKGTLSQLRAFAQEHQVGHPNVIEHGALRLHLRLWVLRHGQHFGRHKGRTFGQIWQEDAQYVQWAVDETAAKTDAGARSVGCELWKDPRPIRSGNGPAEHAEQKPATDMLRHSDAPGRHDVRDQGGCGLQSRGQDYVHDTFDDFEPDSAQDQGRSRGLPAGELRSQGSGGALATGDSCHEGVAVQPVFAKDSQESARGELERKQPFSPADGTEVRARSVCDVLSASQCRMLDRVCSDFEFETYKALRDPNQLFLLEVACSQG